MSGDRVVIQLGHEVAVGMPHPPAHAPFCLDMRMAHEWTAASGSAFTGTAETIEIGTHVGTHIDSVFHVARENCLHGGVRVGDDNVHQSAHEGLTVAGRENFQPIVAPGVILDFPALLGVDRCPNDLEIAGRDLQTYLSWSDLDLAPGDVVLIRTGWDTVWLEDPDAFIGPAIPGVNLDGAKWLRAHEPAAVGSDTFAFEKVPLADQLGPHAELLVGGGIPIFECLNFTDLVPLGVRRFEFVCAPLRMRGATGSPVNPLALITTAREDT
jgi:kynurenine formamidase